MEWKKLRLNCAIHHFPKERRFRSIVEAWLRKTSAWFRVKVKNMAQTYKAENKKGVIKSYNRDFYIFPSCAVFLHHFWCFKSRFYWTKIISFDVFFSYIAIGCLGIVNLRLYLYHVARICVSIKEDLIYCHCFEFFFKQEQMIKKCEQ